MNKKKFMSAIADIGCINCKANGFDDVLAELHHIETVRDRDSDYLIIPLCAECHRGPNGLHGLSRKGFLNRYKKSELDLLKLTIKEMAKCMR